MPFKLSGFIKNKQQRDAEKKSKRLKKEIAERKKDVDVNKRFQSGGVVSASERFRLRRVLEEKRKPIRRNKSGKLT